MPNVSRTKRHGLRAVVTVALLATGSGSALADSYNLRTYFESLQPSYPVQAASNQWSFYAGSAIGGSLISPSGANYYGPETYQQIGTGRYRNQRLHFRFLSSRSLDDPSKFRWCLRPSRQCESHQRCVPCRQCHDGDETRSAE